MGNKAKLFLAKKRKRRNAESLSKARAKRAKINQTQSEECSRSFSEQSKSHVATKNCHVVLDTRSSSAISFLEETVLNTGYNEQHNCSLDQRSKLEKSNINDVFDSLMKDLGTHENEKKSYEEETKSIEELELVKEPTPFRIEGRRIVDFLYFFEQIKIMSDHNLSLGCSISNLQIIREIQNGLESVILFECNMCNIKFEVKLSNSSFPNEMSVNHAAVTGALLIGCGWTNLNELLTAVDLPKLSQTSYNKCHSDVSKWWASAAEASMKEAAKEEADLARERGDIIDGIPSITVVADACWSYRTNYSAASGAAAIIGFQTGKVLYMQVRNKYCVVCARSLMKKKQPPPTHECTRNHTGSSSSMEQASIVEGFKTSIENHNLIYSTLIADGDASTYKKILECRPYPKVQVEKIECTNHLLRNYSNKLMQLQKDTSIPLSERKLLTAERICRLRTAARAAARFRKAQNASDSEKIIKLRDDIMNSPKHVFGDHSSCENYYCHDEKKKGQNVMYLVKNLYRKIMAHVNQIALHSKSLLWNVNNNRAEQFNSIVAKHVGGKRINYSLKNSYTARCYAAVVAFNTGKPLYNLFKTNFEQSPRKAVKFLELRRCKRNIKRRPGPRKKILFQLHNRDYGEKCQKPDLTTEQYETAKTLFLNNLKAIVENRHDIERDTILQAESAMWLELRRCLLTASSFSKVCKRRPNTNSAPLVKTLVYSYSLNNMPAIEHGKKNEKSAIEQLQQQESILVEKCGLFVDKKYYFLGASPDGLYEAGLIEIKCPYSARNMDAEEAILKKKIKFWKVDGTVNTNHDWYYQIQGQLHISEKQLCLFAVWTGPEFRLKIAKIKRDDEFWRARMEPKLVTFYEKCLLPEFVDPRKSRSMPIRDISI